jgi:KTSC domain
MAARTSTPPPENVTWRDTPESLTVARLGWCDDGMIVVFNRSGETYLYKNVSRQRAVAMTRAKSVGQYLNRKIKPNFEFELIAE